MKLGPISFFVSWLQKTMFATTSTEKSKAIPPEKFAISTGSFLINFTSHAIKLRQHSIERDVDLHVVIECLKKNVDTLRSKEANNHRDLQIILKLLSSRQQERRAWIIPTESLWVTQQMLVLRSSAWKCSMVVTTTTVF